MKNDKSLYSGQPVIELIKKRTSIRTYNEKHLTDDIKEKINSFFKNLKGPFGVHTRYMLVENDKEDSSLKLGTYGVIKGAPAFILGAVEKTGMYMEQLGYEFESIILYATSLGLGTCWLGGTFNKSEFSKAIGLKDHELLPIITPVGYPADDRRMLDRFMRFAAGSDNRKEWNNLFFDGSFNKSLGHREAGKYAVPLEMVRLAPSASNKQPWRIVREGGNFHFFLSHSKGYAKTLGFDIQKVDMGIALCHFKLSAEELGIKGTWVSKQPVFDAAAENMEYIISWEEINH